MTIRYKRYARFEKRYPARLVAMMLSAWMRDIDLPEREECFGDPGGRT